MASAPVASTEPNALLRQLEQRFRTRRGDLELDRILPAARERADGIANSAGGAPGAMLLAAVTFAGEVLSELWVERAWTRAQVTQLVRHIADVLGLEPELVSTALYVRAAREQRLTELPPRLAIETQLRMLLAFAPVEEASLWTADPDRRLACIVDAAGGGTSRRAREIAREVLRSEATDDSERARLHGLPVLRWEQPVAALVVRVPPEQRAQALALAQEAAAMIAPLLQLDLLLDRNVARERALVESTERLLVRLGFDIHDGALQELAALASDIRLFQSQLGEVLGDSDRKELILGRIADLEGRVVGIDAELRELTQSLDSPATPARPLTDSIRAEVKSLGEEWGIAAEVVALGDLDDLTSSQSIALARIVQEALSNVREHSGAEHVRVRLRGSRSLLEVEIHDDGRGFEVEERVLEAARGGRLGLVGMAERVRLLGGTLDVDSRPGGPTRIRARIPRWRPATRAAGEAAAPA